MSKKKYINNPYPKFLPINDKLKEIDPIFKEKFKEHLIKNKINKNILLINKINGKILSRYRILNKYRIRAIKVFIKAIIYYLDLKSNFVQACIKKLSDECGLSTISAAGNKSISRASRLITEFMEPMGFLKIKKEKKLSLNLPFKRISVTPLFFSLLNIKKINLFKEINMT